MFVIKDNIIESIKLPGLLGSDMNHNYTLQPWGGGVNNSGVIVLPEILNNENQFLVNNDALNDVITTTTSSTTAYFITNDNEIVGKMLLSSSATISLLSSSNNSFTLSTKVKRQYASISGITSSLNLQLAYCTGLYIYPSNTQINVNIVLLKLTPSIKTFIRENSNVPMLVNVSFLTNTISNASTDSCIAGFFSYSGDGKTRVFYNEHQSSMQYAVNANANYINYNETYITWESINPVVDTYGIRSLSNIIDSDNSPSDILNSFTGNIYYRFEIIVYTG